MTGVGSAQGAISEAATREQLACHSASHLLQGMLSPTPVTQGHMHNSMHQGFQKWGLDRKFSTMQNCQAPESSPVVSAHSEPSPEVTRPYRSQGQCLRMTGKYYHSETVTSPSKGMSASTWERAVWAQPKAVPASDQASPGRLVQRQAIDAALGAQDIEHLVKGQELQVPHLTGKLVHSLDDRGEGQCWVRGVGAQVKQRTNSSNAPAARTSTPDPGPSRTPDPSRPSPPSPRPPVPAPPRCARCSRSAAALPGRRHRPALSQWTGRSPPRGTAREACPPPGPRAGSRSPPGIRPAAWGRPSWDRPGARPLAGARPRGAGAGGRGPALYGRLGRSAASAVRRGRGRGR